jgi:sulfonate transport system ATP-binding protein
MLSVNGLGKTYPNGTIAVRDVTLTIGAGEILSIVGGSGCGKSTLLRLLSGLDHPTVGTVEVDGAQIVGPHPAVGIVFQEPRLLPWLTVENNIGFGLAHLSRAERRDRVHTVLKRVGLSDYGSRWPRELSGGQSQRVAIARALVTRPSVLLLDEPFSALDAFTRVELQDHLLEIWEDTRPTLVLVTHDIEEAVALASRVVVMRPFPGRVAQISDVTLARPRDRLSHTFDDEKRAILSALDTTLSHAGTLRARPAAAVSA